MGKINQKVYIRNLYSVFYLHGGWIISGEKIKPPLEENIDSKNVWDCNDSQNVSRNEFMK